MPNCPTVPANCTRLHSLYGKKLTVVCFWTNTTRREQLEAADIVRSLTDDVFGPFHDKGVTVIGIEPAVNFNGGRLVNKQNDVDAKQAPPDAAPMPTFPCLRDDKGQFLGGLCKDGKLPRIFLLDAEGQDSVVRR